MSSIEVPQPCFADVARPAAGMKRLCTGAVWSEGPVWMRKTGEVRWCDIPKHRILARHPPFGIALNHERHEADDVPDIFHRTSLDRIELNTRSATA